MHCEPDFFRQAERTEKEGRFACYMRGNTPEPIIVEFPFAAIDKEPKMTDAQYQAFLASNRAALTEPQKTHEPPPFDDGSRVTQREPAEADKPIVSRPDSPPPTNKPDSDSASEW
jgi:hypothetical protein